MSVRTNQAAHCDVYTTCVEERVEDLLFSIKLGADVDFQNEDGCTGLHFACVNANLKLVKILLGYGASVIIKNKDGFTPLDLFISHLSVNVSVNYEDCREVMLWLVQVMDARVLAEYEVVLLSSACWCGFTETIAFLLDNQINSDVVNRNDLDRKTPLQQAIDGYVPERDNDYVEIVELLLKNGADVNVIDRFGRTPLYGASWKGCTNIVLMLLEHGANVSGTKHAIPLFKACGQGRSEIVDILIRRGASVNATGFDKRTPLQHTVSEYIAARTDDYMRTVQVLLDHGADVNFVDRYERTPLNDACRTGCTSIVATLIAHGAEPAGTGGDASPLIEAYRYGHIDTVRLLLSSGTDVFSVDVYDIASEIVLGGYNNFILYGWVPADNCLNILKLLLQYTLNFDFNLLLKVVLMKNVMVNAKVQSELHSYILKFHSPPNFVPSLTELCRNKLRAFLRQKCGNTTQFVKAVRALRLPSIVEDVICLRYPTN